MLMTTLQHTPPMCCNILNPKTKEQCNIKQNKILGHFKPYKNICLDFVPTKRIKLYTDKAVTSSTMLTQFYVHAHGIPCSKDLTC